MASSGCILKINCLYLLMEEKDESRQVPRS